MNTRNSWLLLQQEQGCGLQEDFCGFFVSDLPGARCQIARLPNQVGNPTRPVWWCNEKRRKAGRAEHLLRCSKKKGAHAINPILPLSESEERSSAQVFTSIRQKLRSSSHSGRKYDCPSNQLEWLESNILDCVEVKPSSFWPEGPKNKIYPCSEKTNLHHWLI